MKKKTFILSVFLSFLIITFVNGSLKKQTIVEKKINKILSQLSLKEKISLLHGHGFEVSGIKRLGIPPLKMSDGPAGVRWGRATAFPAPVALSATWNPEIVYKVSKAMAEELKAYGRNVFLAPCVNIHRIPVGSRNFESYGEDPYLAGEIAVGFIKGVQDTGVISCVKHYVANNQEWNRTKIDVIVSERALREIYMPAFKKAVKKAGVWSVMSAYNKVNGDYCSANKHLLTDILKNEWGFKGFVVSDWGATHSTIKSAKAGLDIEMPYGKHFSDKLLKAVKEGKVSEDLINDKVRRILRAMVKMNMLGKDFKRKSKTQIKKMVLSHKKLAKEVAEESMVLLKNSNNTLPIDLSKIKSIAIVGPNAKYARTGGGGSAYVRPFYSVSPLKGIKNYLKGKKIKIYYAAGTSIKGDVLPVSEKFVNYNNKNGFLGEYFLNRNLKGKPAMKRIDRELYFNWSYDLPELELGKGNDSNEFSVRWQTELIPPVSGKYRLKFLSDGGIRVYLNGKLILKRWKNPEKTFDINLKTVDVNLIKGNKYKLKIEYSSSWSISEFKFGWDIPGNNPVQKAIDIAKKSDVVIAFLGLSPHFETESRDRDSMEIPNQNELIEKLLEVNPNIVVVLISGTPLNISRWNERVPSILQAWYPGQEGGTAIASVLFGEVTPSGKLSFSWYKNAEDCPGFKGYKDKSLKAVYYDDIFVGYRYLDKEGIKPLYPFGFGLSYTKFEYSDLKTKEENNQILISFSIKNEGNYYGGEVAQIYISPPTSNTPRPIKELKAFKKVFLTPNIKKNIIIKLNINSLKCYDNKNKEWILNKGIYKTLIGSSSVNIKLKGLFKI